jgi:Ca2+-binding EF-hand superfamily protein
MRIISNNIKSKWGSFRWLEGLFNEADINRNGLLCIREVHQLLEKLNVRLTTDEFEQYFEVSIKVLQTYFY